MSPKSTRFEMRLPDETLKHIDDWRNNQIDVPSKAEAIRRLIDFSLATASPNNVALSDGERLILWNQTEIMKRMGGEFDTSLDLIRGVITGGHNWALKWEMQGIFHGEEDSPRTVNEVVDILETWTIIEATYGTLSATDKKQLNEQLEPWQREPEFGGFDGNNESGHLSVAKFLIETMGRFGNFKGRELNSHMPTVDDNLAIAQAFKPMRRKLMGGGLMIADLVTLLKRR